MTSPSRCVIFAGPNGSGKSSLVRSFFADPLLDVPHRFINADDIARDLTNGSQLDKEKAAFRQARQLREDFRVAGLSFSFETVFSHPSTLLDLIKLRAAGYETQFIFVATSDVQINVSRVRERVQSGGHNVPQDKIRTRYERALTFLPIAAEIADRTVVWDNTVKLSAVCEVRDGTIMETENCTDFYRTRFIVPFQERRQERLDLSLYLRRSYLKPAEIERGSYEGHVVENANYFCVQDVNGTLILHDRTLLTSDPPQNETVRVTYRDGYGTVETVSDASPNNP